jgi:uncharacterized protein (DUF885 family)
MRVILAAAMLALLVACKPAAPSLGETPEAQTTRLVAYLDAEFEEELAMNPERLTSLGRKEHYGELNDYSSARQTRMLEWRRESVGEMRRQFVRDLMSPDGQTYFDIWALELDRAERNARFPRHPYVFGYNSSPHSAIPNFLISNHRVDDISDMEAYVSRLNAIPRALDQSIERAKEAASDGIRTPRFQYERVINESGKVIHGQPFADGGPPSPLWEDATKKIAALVAGGKATQAQADELTAKVRVALLEQVKPAYERVIAWARSDIDNAPSGAVGAVTLPDGAEWYANTLYQNTTTDMTAEEIHQLGLSEVSRIHGEMDALARANNFADRAAYLAARVRRTDTVLPRTDAGRAEYLRIANETVQRVRAELPKWFGEVAQYDMVVQREPSFSEIPGGAAHASRATPNGSKPGVVYVHLQSAAGFRKPAIISLMCHEAAPGHLLQGDIMVRQTGVPKFRTAYGYTAFSEGWGLYSEALCKEMGIYTNLDSDYERLEAELWRAVRLVLDTGLHAKRWTEDEAVAYAVANTSRDEEGSRAEVQRFLGNPGQATAYKIGMIRIQAIRREAEQALGDRFDIRGFHDVVIGAGSVPLSILDQRVRAWVETQKTAPAPAPTATSTAAH